MLFTREHVPLIRSGRKTQTRRLKNPRVCVGRRYPVRTVLFKRQRLGYVLVTGIRQERLARITDAAARREGHRNRHDYLAAFREINGSCDLRRRIYVVSFIYRSRKQ